ncbi:general substrate transporter [Sporodiniella umbellata]|nr:general substrate transporter [Sporodiniella umbellata]
MRLPYKIYFICCFVSLGGFMYGYDSGMLTSILIYPSFEKKFQLFMDQPAGFSIVSVSLAASLIASFVSGFIADRLGRKWFLMVAAVIHTLGAVVEIAGQSQSTFFVGRIVTGFSIGIFSMLVPLYQSELAESHHRGKLIAIYQLFITLGFCVAFWIGYGTFSIKSDAAWRIPLGIQLIPGILLILGIYFIPESPRWLIYRDQPHQGLQILADLRSQGDTQQVEVRMEFTSILQEVQFDRMAYRHRFLSLFKKGTDNFRKRTLLGLGIHTFTQLSGINAILFYFPHILESAGLSGVYSALLGNGIGGLVNFIATLLVVFYIDRWGRRKILILGALGMALCMITITIVSALFDQDLITTRTEIQYQSNVTNPQASYSITVLLCIFIAIFALSWYKLSIKTADTYFIKGTHWLDLSCRDLSPDDPCVCDGDHHVL